MNGAESLIQTAVDADVEVCFANPGTTEMHVVAALDTVSGMRGVLGLFEGVVTGAADGYGRMSDKPALTLLHLGPGFANGIANLHNARRARTPIVNVIGHQATWQRNFDAPLTSDVEVLAAPMSAWQRTCASSDHISFDTAAAISAAMASHTEGPGQIATLVVPADVQWNEAPSTVETLPKAASHGVSAGHIEDIATLLRIAVESGNAESTTILLGGHGLRQRGLLAASKIAAKTGVKLVCETFAGRMERGPQYPALLRLPYFPEQVQEFLKGTTTLILAGSLEPVSFFGYEHLPARLLPADTVLTELATPTDDVANALEDLAQALDAHELPGARELVLPGIPEGGLTPSSIAQTIAAHLPENAIVVDEGVTSAGGFYPATSAARSHSYLNLTGGAIGWGIPSGLGASIACPDRKVVVLEGDGSGLYTNQGLWSLARENANVVVIVFVNDLYRILQVELTRSGVEDPGAQSLGLTQLDGPPIDWVSLAKGYGLSSTRVHTAPEFGVALERACQEHGPHLIAVQMSADAPGAGP